MKMDKIPRWCDILDSMEPDIKKDFQYWWRGLPQFSHAFDMQAIVVLSFLAGRKSVNKKTEA